MDFPTRDVAATYRPYGKDGMSDLQIGLANPENKYLTAETFGFKINAGATSCKNKQAWTIEFGDSNNTVYLKSHLGRYVSTDKMGNVTCDAEVKDSDQTFFLEYETSGKGRWAFKNKSYGKYLGGSDENLNCNFPTAQWWSPYLAIHPQVNMRNLNRKRYVHLKRLNGNNDELECTEVIPWGADCLITFIYTENGYALESFDNRYLHMDGRLVESITSDTLFNIQLYPMKDSNLTGINFKHGPSGKYLTAVGQGTMKCKNQTISKDEVFILQESYTQVTLVSTQTGKRASIKQGIDLICNQDEMEHTEIFQMELVQHNGKGMYRFRTNANTFWTLNQGTSGVQAVEIDSNTTEKSLFEIIYCQDGFVNITGSNGKFITVKPTGAIYANGTADQAEKFAFVLINRPVCILRGSHGYVAYKTKGNPKLECNKSIPDVFKLQYSNNTHYSVASLDGKYWNLKDDGTINADAASPQEFQLEFQPHLDKFAIKAKNGKYVVGEQRGLFSATGASVTKDALWEY